MMIKIYFAEIKQTLSPSRIVSIKYENKPLDIKIQKGVLNYFLVYIILFTVILLVVTVTTDDFITAFSAVAATFNNIGPGLGKVGPTYSFAELTDINKIVLSFGMLAGRLELFPMLVLFAPNTWRLR